jgi:hypothetical protein
MFDTVTLDSVGGVVSGPRGVQGLRVIVGLKDVESQ